MRSGTGHPRNGPKGQQSRYTGIWDLQDMGAGTMTPEGSKRGPKGVIFGVQMGGPRSMKSGTGHPRNGSKGQQCSYGISRRS